MSKLKILCLPGTRMRASNPFTALLADGLTEAGACVQDFTMKDAIVTKYDAIIIHWPDHFSSQRALPIAIIRTLSLILVLTWQRLRGAKIVRVVHDVSALFPQRRWLRSINQKIIGRLVTDFLFLSQSSETAFRGNFPSAATRRGLRLFHPRYDPVVSPALTAGTQAPREKCVNYVGDIKPYKGLHNFLAHIAEHPLTAPFNIYGRCEEPAYRATIASKISTARAAGNDINWDENRPSAAEFNQRVGEAGLLLLPYLDGWNSGMALSALEAGTPILATSLPIFEELKKDIGNDWITTYTPESGDLPRLIERRLSSSPSGTDQKVLAAYLERLDWKLFSTSLFNLLNDGRETDFSATNPAHQGQS